MVSVNRAQASWGVMEILISTIILGMSMGVVFFALKNIEETRCISDLKSQTVKLQNAVLNVALGSPPSNDRAVLKLPACGDRSVEAIRFVYYKSRELCRLCPGQYNGCWIIEPVVYDFKQKKLYPLVDAATCIQMPADISLEGVSDTGGLTSGCRGSEMTNNPCPSVLPDGSACTSDNYAIPANVVQNSVWKTFGRKMGDSRYFTFELSKSVTTGLTSSVKICPKSAG